MLSKEELIIKYLKNDCSDKEQHQVNQWLQESELNQLEFDELRTIWLSSEVVGIDPEARWKEFEKKATTEDKPIFNIYRIAASLLLLTAIGFSYLYFKPIGNTNSSKVAGVIESSSNHKKEIILPDGSLVTLNENSSIEYGDDFQTSRNVKLKGEAFFDVKRNENHPFTITTETIQVKVLGTSFNVNVKLASKASVQVASGIVEVTTLATKETVRIVKDEQVVVDNDKLIKTSMINNNGFSWKTEIIEFKNQNLATVFEELSSIYDIEIELNKKLNSCIVTARFHKNSLVEVISLLKKIYQLDVQLVNSKLIIDGKPCS